MPILQETICHIRNTKNGSSPLWCAGSTTIMRKGDTVFVTVPANDPDVLPLADRHIALFAKTGSEPWQSLWKDPRFTREPAPLLRLPNGNLSVTLNPSVRDIPPGEGIEYGPALPILATFSPENMASPRLETLSFGAPYVFSDHSYRGSAVDAKNGDLFITWQYLVKNGGAHCFLLRTEKGDTCGKLDFPRRACYHNLAIQDGKAYVCAVSDIVEPVEEWRAYKKEKTGIHWDYDFRNLYFTSCDDLESGRFGPILTVESREETCGYTFNYDLFVQDDTAYLVYAAKRFYHGFMQEKFFPTVPADNMLCLCAVQNGKVLWKKTLDLETQQSPGENLAASYGAAFFQKKDGSVGLLISKNGGNQTGLADGWHIAENVFESENISCTSLPIACPPGSFHTARPRCGALPADQIDVLTTAGEEVVYLHIPL